LFSEKEERETVGTLSQIRRSEMTLLEIFVAIFIVVVTIVLLGAAYLYFRFMLVLTRSLKEEKTEDTPVLDRYSKSTHW
jgi:hypothetical protein